MSRASAAQNLPSFGDQPEVMGQWEEILTEAFADPDRTSGFLEDAEIAVRAQPGDGPVLLLAATAALLDRNPERAQIFLKRFSKRFFAGTTWHLLRGLALAQEGKLGLARVVLEDHGLAKRFESFLAFSGRMGQAGMAVPGARPDFRTGQGLAPQTRRRRWRAKRPPKPRQRQARAAAGQNAATFRGRTWRGGGGISRAGTASRIAADRYRHPVCRRN
jgi:hypothetical protein